MASFPPSPPLPPEMSKKKRGRDEGDDREGDNPTPAVGVGAGPSAAAPAPDRSLAWWDLPDYQEEEFRYAFRMGRKTFDMVCEELRSVLRDPQRRTATPGQRVAMCIWWLASGDSIRKVSKQFGLSASACHNSIIEVCYAIAYFLMPKFLHLPADAAAAEGIKSRFESLSGIPNVIGSMYTTHISVNPSKVHEDTYFNCDHTERNQRASYSTIIQGVVDPDGIFTHVTVGWPGSMSDEQVLEKSELCLSASEGKLNNSWVVGGSSYPLMDWVLVPYTHQHLTSTQQAFNEKIREVQSVGREAFVRLKRRWSLLQKLPDVKRDDLCVVLSTCFVLHNICEMNKEEIDPELQCELFDDERVPENGLRSLSMMQARENIANNLLHHGLAGSSFLTFL